MPRLLPVLLGLLPAITGAQRIVGLAEVSTDTVHHGVFLELAGVGGITLSYEHHFGRLITQAGVAKWSYRALGDVRRANALVVTSAFREFSLDGIIDRTSFELGGGLTGGYHARDGWAEVTVPARLDTVTPPDPVDQVRRIRGRYLAMTGLVGLRFKPAIPHDMTLRIGWVPILRLYDQPESTSYLRGSLAFSGGFTW